MEYKYKQEFRKTIATVLFENKIGRVHHSEIRRGVERILHHTISDRQLLKNLSTMVQEKLLNKDDPTGKRGSRVHYSLTEKGERTYRLKILGTDKAVEKRKSLYLLLIFFEVYKRMPLVTEKQLAKFLKQIGSSIDRLEKVQEVNLFENNAETIFKPINGVEIAGFTHYDPETKSNKIWYYTVIPGFSVDEFIFYLRLLKSGIEPRPFFAFRTIIPFIGYASYTETEVRQAIDTLKEDGLIKPINAIIPGESRFNIADDTMRRLIYDIWLVRIYDFELLNIRLIHNKPTDEDKKYLALYLGERADLMVALTYDSRRAYKKETENETMEEAIREIEQRRRLLVQEIIERYQKVIHENRAVYEIIEGICFLPFPSQNFT